MSSVHQLALGMQEALDSVQPVKLDQAKTRRKHRGEQDRDWWFRHYLPHWFDTPSSPFHHDLDEVLPAKTRINRLAPREHAKSTRGVEGDILYNLYHKRTRFSVVLRATLEEAYEVVGTLLHELETNERLRYDYGDLYHPRKWGRKGFVTRWDQMVVAKSRGGKIRGIKFRHFRPDHLYLDDVDDEKSVNTVELRKKTRDWFRKVIVPSVAKGGSIVSVGTALAEDCLVCWLDDNPVWDSRIYKAFISWPERVDLWERWETIARERDLDAAMAFYREHEAEMLKGAEVLWPERYSVLDLMLKRLEIGPTAFSQEYQNEPRDEETAIVRADWLLDYEFGDVWGRVPLTVVTACDPATGRKTERACQTAIVTVGAAANRIYVLETLSGRWSAAEAELRLYEAWQRWRSTAVVIETIGFQVWLADLCRQKAAKRGKPMPIAEIDHQTADKVARCQHLATYIENGVLRFLPEQTAARHQLVAFRTRNDPCDIVDALELAVRRVAFGAGPIEFQSTGINRLAGMEAY